MRASLIGSSLAHVSLLAAVFAVPKSSPIIVPGPEVVQVSLMDPAALRTPPAPAPPRPPEPKVESVRPTEDTGVKLAPEKPPKQKKKTEPKESPPPSQPAAALPYAPVGNAGLSGQIAVDAADFEFNYYLMLVRNRIASNWTPPAGLVTSGRPARAVIYFRIERGGELTNLRLETTSSVEYFDRSALRAVTISNPLPPLPLGYSGQDLGVHFGFEYSSP